MSAMTASRALMKALPVLPESAAFTRSVTSLMVIRISACMPGHSRSSRRVAAMKPDLM